MKFFNNNNYTKLKNITINSQTVGQLTHLSSNLFFRQENCLCSVVLKCLRLKDLKNTKKENAFGRHSEGRQYHYYHSTAEQGGDA